MAKKSGHGLQTPPGSLLFHDDNEVEEEEVEAEEMVEVDDAEEKDEEDEEHDDGRTILESCSKWRRWTKTTSAKAVQEAVSLTTKEVDEDEDVLRRQCRG